LAKGHRLCQPKPKVQTKVEAKAPDQAPKGA
jgi:large subunit ribosomal protein L29e